MKCDFFFSPSLALTLPHPSSPPSLFSNRPPPPISRFLSILSPTRSFCLPFFHTRSHCILGLVHLPSEISEAPWSQTGSIPFIKINKTLYRGVLMSAGSRGGMEERSVCETHCNTCTLVWFENDQKKQRLRKHYIHISSCGAELFSRLARAELMFARMPGPLMANGCVHWYIYLGNTHSSSSLLPFGHVSPPQRWLSLSPHFLYSQCM